MSIAMSSSLPRSPASLEAADTSVASISRRTTVFEVFEKGCKRKIRLEVVEPVTITAKDYLLWASSFTTYLIRIETNHYAFSLPISEVRRRYSEFCWLRSKLCYHHPNKDVPPLPSKNFLYVNKFSSSVIEERRFGLGKFLQRVMRSSELLSDSALHYFLQTDLTTREIDERISDEVPIKNRIPFPSSPMSISSSYGVSEGRPYLSRSSSSSSDEHSTDRSMAEAAESAAEWSADEEFDDVSSSHDCGDMHFHMSN